MNLIRNTIHSENSLLREYQTLSTAGGYVVRLMAFPIGLFHFFSERCFNPEQICRALSNVSMVVSVLGAGGTAISFVSFFFGYPSAVVWNSLLTVTAAAGAFSASKAARYYAEVKNVGELRKHLEEMRVINQEFGRQTTLLTTQNVTLKETADRIAAEVDRFKNENANLNADVNRLATQNAALTTNVDHLDADVNRLTTQNVALATQATALKENVTQFALQNESYRTIAEHIGTYVEQSHTGNVQDQGELTRRLEEMTQQIAASRILWDQVSRDHTTQMAQVKELVAKLSDPRNTLLSMREYQAINRQIQTATERLTDLKTQIALKDGQVKARDQVLTELRDAHHGILESYGEQNTLLGERKKGLETQVNRMSVLLNSHAQQGA